MHRVSPLLRASVIMSPFDQPAGVHHADSPEERVDDYSISFVESGRLCPSAVFPRPGWCSTPAIKNTAPDPSAL
jgi:hypothetical protein